MEGRQKEVSLGYGKERRGVNDARIGPKDLRIWKAVRAEVEMREVRKERAGKIYAVDKVHPRTFTRLREGKKDMDRRDK